MEEAACSPIPASAEVPLYVAEHHSEGQVLAGPEGTDHCGFPGELEDKEGLHRMLGGDSDMSSSNIFISGI